jgi:hypothetical protein
MTSGLQVYVGVSGAGKTHAVRADVYRACRRGLPVIVIDRMHEWGTVPSDMRAIASGATDIAQATDLIASGKRLVVLRAPGDVVKTAEDVCAWVRSYPGPAGVAIPEAHRAAPNAKPLPIPIEDIVCAWRHYQATVWCDTQRIALLNRTITEQARTLKLFAIVGDRDTKVVADIGGKALSEQVRECAVRLARGEPGWHVALDLARCPPYELSREGA